MRHARRGGTSATHLREDHGVPLDIDIPARLVPGP